MRRTVFLVLQSSALLLLSMCAFTSGATAERGQARQQQAEPRPREAPRHQGEAPPERPAPQHAEPRREGDAPRAEEARRGESRQRAEPRPPAAPPERSGSPRRAAPPPRVVPPQFDRGPRVYHFPPVSLHRGFYYHPYFGFYYGPYYGPFYPHPGPFVSRVRSSTGAIRTRVKPVDTEVYLNGYYAGLVDDFDGVFQRLYVPAGEHDVELHLDGYRTHRLKLYVGPGDTREFAHQMLPLRAGEAAELPINPRALPEDWTGAEAPTGDRPASPFGVLSLCVDPADARIIVDGDVWLGTASQTELVIHIPSGWHRLEVRKDGYQPFQTEIELSEGATTRLNVRLER